jgi:hypothetical protein
MGSSLPVNYASVSPRIEPSFHVSLFYIDKRKISQELQLVFDRRFNLVHRTVKAQRIGAKAANYMVVSPSIS